MKYIIEISRNSKVISKLWDDLPITATRHSALSGFIITSLHISRMYQIFVQKSSTEFVSNPLSKLSHR